MNHLRQSIYLFTGLCLVFFAFTSCSDEEMGNGKTGILQLSVGFNSKTITVETRAASDSDSCKVLVKNSDGDIIRKFDKVADIPAELWLITGKYTVEASTGTPKTAEFDNPYYAGKSEISVQANQAVKQEVVCRLAQSKVSVLYGKDLNTYYTDYSTTVALDKTTLEFKKDSTKVGYFYAPNGDKDLLCTVTGKNNKSEDITTEYTIKNIKPYTHYIINVNINNSDDGGLKFTIEAEEDPDVVEDDMSVIIKEYPKIEAIQYEETATDFVFFEDEMAVTPEHFTIKVSAGLSIKELTINSEHLKDLNGIGTDKINLMNLTATELESLKSAGFRFDTDPSPGIKKMEIEVPVKTNKAAPKKDFTISITDAHDQNRTQPYTLFISDMKVATDWRKGDFDAWATYATLRGRWFTAVKPSGIIFQYKKKTETDWTDISEGDITFVESTRRFYAKANYSDPSLTNSVEYEYRIQEGGKTTDPQPFIAEAAKQIPNSNFDVWSDEVTSEKTHKDVYPFLPSDSERWWDTANGGTKSLGKFPTFAERADVKEGEAAAKLTSMDLNIKFAAGNIYTGTFEKITMEGGGGATLYFGKSYTNRPTKLKGWFKYASGIVDKFADSRYINKDGNDIGSIQIALCYWPNNPKGHFMDTTKPTTFLDFSENNSSIIAYGTLSDSEISSTMSSYKSFEIKLKYRDLTKKPTHIVIIGSASKYGDYFCGSENSVLLLDDFQLVFDDEVIEE